MVFAFLHSMRRLQENKIKTTVAQFCSSAVCKDVKKKNISYSSSVLFLC